VAIIAACTTSACCGWTLFLTVSWQIQTALLLPGADSRRSLHGLGSPEPFPTEALPHRHLHRLGTAVPALSQDPDPGTTGTGAELFSFTVFRKA